MRDWRVSRRRTTTKALCACRSSSSRPAILISDQLFAGNENQVRETLRLVEEVTYDLTSQSVPRPDPVRSIPNQILGHMKVI